MINKELLSEVFTQGQINFSNIEAKENMVNYHYEQEVYIGDGDSNIEAGDGCINIHELAYKCKEWAIAQGYNANSCLSYCSIEKFHTFEKHQEYADTEPEAIIKACQWIMDNRDV